MIEWFYATPMLNICPSRPPGRTMMFSKKKNIPPAAVSRSVSKTEQIDLQHPGLVVEEKRICVDDETPHLPPQISIDDISAKNFLMGVNRSFDKIRFDINLLLSYQPSFERALNDWPDWRNKQHFKCIYCGHEETLPVKVTKVERLVVYGEIPAYKEVVGWKVSGAECKVAKCFLIDHTQGDRTPIYTWDYAIEGKKVICKECAERMKGNRKQSELLKYLILDPKS
jgi:hypothetical protein